MRRKVIAGNWKMNKNQSETKALITELKPLVWDASCTVICCVPFTSIAAATEAASGSDIKIAAQNCHWAASGAFTGEISADMLAEMGVEYVVIGHSERRQYFGETDETVNKRVRAALDAGLTVILCVGELLEQREAGITEEVCTKQTTIALAGISNAELSRVIIAYEPVWAIGTGKTATNEQADEACGCIRDVVAKLYDKTAAEQIIIQYGGSMNAANAAELLAMQNVDGGLIGGASLKAQDFSVIVKAAG
jgi:triosephosphate isomerase